VDVPRTIEYTFSVLGFFFFTGGIFIWIIPFFLIIVGVRALRRFLESGRREDEYSDELPRVINRTGNQDNRESLIFKLADRMKGRVTLSDIVLETGMGLKEAESFIKKMIDGVHVTMEVTDTGKIIYEFPEIISRYENTD